MASRNKVYQSKDGSWYARVNGRRWTLNTRAEHQDLLRRMEAVANQEARDADRTAPPADEDHEVIILRGLPGSGKTTWAREFIRHRSWYKHVSKDALREMFDFGRYDSSNEKFIRLMQDKIVHELLREGRRVVVDNTNLSDWHVRQIMNASLVYWQGKSYLSVMELEFHTPLDECIRRDALRPNPVGAERIREMAERYGWHDAEEDDEELIAERAEMAALIERLAQVPYWAAGREEQD